MEMEMEVQRDRRGFGATRPGQQWRRRRRTAGNTKLVPRSSSPVSVYVELPCVIEQAFSTIAWDDLEDCASAVRLQGDSIGSQVNESDGDEQDFGDYALDFMADSPATLESSLSAEMVPFQGCVLPILTPQRCFSSGGGLVHFSTGEGAPPSQDGAPWQGIAQYQHRALGDSMEVNKQLHETLQRRQDEIDSLQERNRPLRQLASRAKHLASVLEKLMTISDPHVREPAMPCGDQTSLSPCKRQRLDEGYETESSDSVEDMLRDISTRCNAVLHGANAGSRTPQEPETIRMHGSFSGLQTSVSSSSAADRAEPDEIFSSFRTSIQEHCTMRTRVLPHGRAFTSRTQQGGYRFRWVPN
ncbi:multicilin [Anoplopoma fimbria]|uniref:multicilin n=1 Tax=Anoplopoma fimbria TaxID=229290 RepID=UPI0023ECBCA8|nr:multicilin [Anoplopoma fimbria]